MPARLETLTFNGRQVAAADVQAAFMAALSVPFARVTTIDAYLVDEA